MYTDLDRAVALLHAARFSFKSIMVTLCYQAYGELLARALANDPDVLLADDPKGNLDSQTREEIITLLEAQHAAVKTLVIVKHEAELAALAEARLELSDGRIVTHQNPRAPQQLLLVRALEQELGWL